MGKKTFWWIVLILGIMLIDFIPGPTDIIPLQIYSAFTGADVSPSNLPVIYLDYFIWSFIAGAILILISLNFLGWDLKKLFRKLDFGKYKLAILLSFGVVIAMTFFNLENYWFLLVLPVIYYFYEKDFSEALALGLSSLILLLFGFGKLLSFVFARTSIPEVIEMESSVVSWISSTLGFETINLFSLIISIFIGFLLVILVTKVLKERF